MRHNENGAHQHEFKCWTFEPKRLIIATNIKSFEPHFHSFSMVKFCNVFFYRCKFFLKSLEQKHGTDANRVLLTLACSPLNLLCKSDEVKLFMIGSVVRISFSQNFIIYAKFAYFMTMQNNSKPIIKSLINYDSPCQAWTLENSPSFCQSRKSEMIFFRIVS